MHAAGDAPTARLVDKPDHRQMTACTAQLVTQSAFLLMEWNEPIKTSIIHTQKMVQMPEGKYSHPSIARAFYTSELGPFRL